MLPQTHRPEKPTGYGRLLTVLVPLALLLTYCDLGNFEPEDIFARSPLEEDALALTPNNVSGCNTTFFANQGDIEQTSEGFDIKGSLYFENGTGETIYLTNGEFQALTDEEGDLNTLEGFGLALFPDAGILEQARLENVSLADMRLNKGSFFNESGEIPLKNDACYLEAVVNEGSATILTDQGSFDFKRYYLSPTDPFILYEGGFSLKNLSMTEGLVGISYNGLIPFEPETNNEDIVFKAFNGHLWTKGTLPFIVNDVMIVSEGETVINAAPPSFDEAKAFFDGNPIAYHQGNEGGLSISYGLLDAILAGHSFNQNTALREQDTLRISDATSVFTFELGTEQFDFVGTYGDTLDIYQELLPNHPILQRLSLIDKDSIGIYGTFGTNEATWSISTHSKSSIEMEGVGELSLEQAVLTLTNNTVELSGFFQSPFAHIPSMLIAGEIAENGDMLLQGQRTLAVLYGNVTLPTTFFITVQIEDGVPTVQIAAQAEDCDGNNCTQKLVEVTFDFGTENSQLCIDNGTLCTN